MLSKNELSRFLKRTCGTVFCGKLLAVIAATANLAAFGESVEVSTVADLTAAVTGSANGDYRISTGSPCARAGRYEAWMAGATDFFGNPRSTSSGKVSIGFHQTQGSGTLVIIR